MLKWNVQFIHNFDIVKYELMKCKICLNSWYVKYGKFFKISKYNKIKNEQLNVGSWESKGEDILKWESSSF